MICLICGKDVSANHFPQHLRFHHNNLSYEEYKDKFGLQKYCACGCGAKIEDHCTWVRGHHVRVNNPSKNPKVKEDRRKQMQEWHDSGTWTPWNKGISDERTRAYGQAGADTRSKDENWRKNVVTSMKKNRVTLKGEKHWNWKGGTSPLVCMLRSDKSLYKLWKYPILVKFKFKCSFCDSTKFLTVHHDVTPMCEIVKLFIPEDKHELSYEEKKNIIQKIVQYHVENSVSGIVLCKPCHKKLHNGV